MMAGMVRRMAAATVGGLMVVLMTGAPCSARDFYVDPGFTRTGDGSAAAPWNTLCDEGTPAWAARWAAINAALAAESVTVYVSARRSDRDTSAELRGAVRIDRTDRSDHPLTLDGQSRWNAGGDSPRWRENTGSSRARVRPGRGSLSIGWDDDVQRDHVTIRGFEVTGPGARVRWGGSHTVLERMWVHDVSGVGATVQFNAAVSDWPECRDYGRCRDVVIRDNRIERGIGEGIYLAGTYTRTEDGGCPAYGPTHEDILIEGNTILDPGANGEEGDGIDLKAGLVRVTVRGNTVRWGPKARRGFDGVTALGRPDGGRTDYVIEDNRIDGAKHGVILGGLNGAVIRRNVIERSTRVGLYLCADPGRPDRDVRIEDNRVLAAGLGLGEVDGVVLRRNVVVGRGKAITGWSARGVDSDGNTLSPEGSEFPEGPHSVVKPAP